jgi:hypothetical protein
MPLKRDRLELFCGPVGECGRDGLLGRLALQDVQQSLLVADIVF